MPKLRDLLALSALAVILFVFYEVFIVSPENAHKTTCQSNLKQITLGLKQYTQDYDELFPVVNVRNVGTMKVGSLRATHWVKALQPYTKSVTVFQCPDFEEAVGTDYYYSKRLSGVNEVHYKHSERMVLLCEGPDTANASLATATAPITAGDPPVYSRHKGGSNYAFVDGHVKWLGSNNAPGNQPAAKGGFTFNS